MPSTTKILTNIHTLVTMEGRRTAMLQPIHDAVVIIRDNVIVWRGVAAEMPVISEQHEVIDLHDHIVFPGLVNTHHHLYQWLTRGRATSCDLFTWLQELYPVWARISVEDVGVAATVGLAELALSGATTVADHHYIVPHGDDSVFDAIASAGRTVGVRLHLSRGSMDLGQSAGGLPPDDVVERTDAILASTESVVARLHDGDRVTVVVAPCS